MSLAPGSSLGPYAILADLGHGGMGVVYTAQDPRLKRQVAIKVLPPELTRDDTAKQRFLQEAKAASALDHPNICTIHEINETDDGRSSVAAPPRPPGRHLVSGRAVRQDPGAPAVPVARRRRRRRHDRHSRAVAPQSAGGPPLLPEVVERTCPRSPRRFIDGAHRLQGTPSPDDRMHRSHLQVGDAAPSGDVERHEWHTRDRGERLPARAPRHPRTTVVRSSGRAARPPAGVATERR